MHRKKLKSKWRKRFILCAGLAFLSFTPFIMGASSKFVDDKYTYKSILELKFGKDVDQYNGDVVLDLTSKFLYDNALKDIQGIKLLLNEIKENSLIALYRNEATKEYNQAIKNEKSRVKSEKESYQDLYGDNWESKWNDQLKKNGHDTEEEYILHKIRSTITKSAFKEIYKGVKTKYTDDNNTPDDDSDDKEQEYEALGVNQLFWFNKWFTRKRPLHLAELKITLKVNNDDYNDITVPENDQEKLDNLIHDLYLQEQSQAQDIIDFSGLVTAYSSGSKTNGGNLGLINYTDTKISSIASRYNLYKFIHDVYVGELRENSEIVLDDTSNGDTLLDVFKTGERNYFYFDIKGEKFLISKNEKASISIFRIFGIKDYIDATTRSANNYWIDYFKNAPKTFKTFTTAPFNISTIINNFIKNEYPNHAYILSADKGIISFVNEKLNPDIEMEERISNYLKIIKKGKIGKEQKEFLKKINDQNEKWSESKDSTSTIDVSDLETENAWALWGV